MRTPGTLLALGLLVVARPVLAQQTPTVAVLDFEASSITLQDAAAVGKGVTGMMITELNGRPGLKVIERQQIQSILQEQKLALSGRIDEATAAQIGKMLGAQYMVAGQVTLWGQDARMDVRITKTETTEILRADKLRGKPEDLLDMVVQIADQFTKDLKLEAPSSKPVKVEIPFAATLFYSRGVDYEDKGQKDKALEMYKKALEAFPEHREAKAAAERLEKGGKP